MAANHLRLVSSNEQKTATRCPRDVIVDLQSTTKEIVAHIETHGLSHTGEEWLLLELREIEQRLRGLLGKAV